jgi:outer membrane protein OmpA-like peptidoglycan-associated protein
MRKIFYSLSAGLVALAMTVPAAAQDAEPAAPEPAAPETAAPEAAAPETAAPEAASSGSASFSTSTGFSSEGDFMSQYTPEAGLIELGIFGGGIWISKDHNLRDVNNAQLKIDRPSFELGLRAAYFPLSFLGVEGEGALGFGKAGGDSATLMMARLHAIAQLPGSRITPFIVVGGGRIAEKSDKLGNDGDPSAHAGIGAKMALTDMFGVRLDLRDNVTTKNPDVRSSSSEWAHHPEALLGLSLTLGRTPPPPPVKDRDGDGFLDPDDKCPDEKGIAPDGCPVKDTDGDGFLDPDDKCPTEKGVAPDGCPVKDTDGDGFLDPDDKCPEEKGVAPDGCPDNDTDKDGILNPDDKCPTEPETKNGYEDEDGCPDEIPEAIKNFSGVMKGIEFDVNKATIRKKSFATLDAAVKVLTDYPKLRIEVSGHTDTDGKKDHNMQLSADRADSVKKYLVDKGIAADRIETRGAGPDEPIAPNDTNANKQKNRRIEFKILQ